MPIKAGASMDDVSSAASDTLNDLKDKVSETAQIAKDKLSSAARQTADQINTSRRPAADALESVASTLHEKAASLPGGQGVRTAAHSTADKLESTADYIREHDLKTMGSDLESLVRRNPGISLMSAAAIGFLIGCAFRRKA